jgi:hypothetical protein
MSKIGMQSGYAMAGFVDASLCSTIFPKGVPVIHDDDQYSTDLMKCVSALEDKEALEHSRQVCIVTLGTHAN